MDLSTSKVSEIALNPQVVKVRNSILDSIVTSETKVIITIGDVAKDALEAYPDAKNYKVVNLMSALDDPHARQWNKESAQIASALGTETSGAYNGELMAIPRKDLPAHTRYWMGTSGSRAYRAYLMNGRNKVWNGDYCQFQAPSWVDTAKYPAYESEVIKKNEEDPNNYVESINMFKSSFQGQ